jgi:hypothetical protein
MPQSAKVHDSFHGLWVTTGRIVEAGLIPLAVQEVMTLSVTSGLLDGKNAMP